MNVFALAMGRQHRHARSPVRSILTRDRKLLTSNSGTQCGIALAQLGRLRQLGYTHVRILGGRERAPDTQTWLQGSLAIRRNPTHPAQLKLFRIEQSCKFALSLFTVTTVPTNHSASVVATQLTQRIRSESYMCAQLHRICFSRRLISRMNGVPAIRRWEKTYEVQNSCTAWRSSFDGGNSGLRRYRVLHCLHKGVFVP